MLGAPDLTDKSWIYGGDPQSIFTTVWGGRQGHMPTWEGRLSRSIARSSPSISSICGPRAMSAGAPHRMRPQAADLARGRLGHRARRGANGHLVYVAVTSQPDCVAHVRQGEGNGGAAFQRRQSSCSPLESAR